MEKKNINSTLDYESLFKEEAAKEELRRVKYSIAITAARVYHALLEKFTSQEALKKLVPFIVMEDRFVMELMDLGVLDPKNTIIDILKSVFIGGKDNFFDVPLIDKEENKEWFYNYIKTTFKSAD